MTLDPTTSDGSAHAWQLAVDQPFAAADEMALLEGLESMVGFCLEMSNVFAIVSWEREFCQLALDTDNDMRVETSMGSLAAHAGFHEEVEGFDWMGGNRLPADWPARDKMAASAMLRAFIDSGGMTFPAQMKVTILPTLADGPLEEVVRPHTPGAATLGFLYSDDPFGAFVDAHAARFGLDPQTASLAALKDAVQAQVEADFGPLNRIDESPASADIVVEVTLTHIEVRDRRDDGPVEPTCTLSVAPPEESEHLDGGGENKA